MPSSTNHQRQLVSDRPDGYLSLPCAEIIELEFSTRFVNVFLPCTELLAQIEKVQRLVAFLHLIQIRHYIIL